jgi:hypothetical protein
MEAVSMQIGRVPVLIRSPAIPAQRRGKGLSQLTSTPKEAARAQLVKSKFLRQGLITQYIHNTMRGRALYLYSTHIRLVPQLRQTLPNEGASLANPWRIFLANQPHFPVKALT